VRRFTGRSVAETLSKLLDSPAVAAKCKELAARCDGRASLATACEALERLADAHAAR
jgi:hypothetical protein